MGSQNIENGHSKLAVSEDTTKGGIHVAGFQLDHLSMSSRSHDSVHGDCKGGDASWL
jgi:hypothetical protein